MNFPRRYQPEAPATENGRPLRGRFRLVSRHIVDRNPTTNHWVLVERLGEMEFHSAADIGGAGRGVATDPKGVIQQTRGHAVTSVKIQTKFFQTNPKATLADLQKEMMKQPETLKKFGPDWVHFQVDGAADAIRYLVDHGVKVINFSGGLKRSLCPSAEKWKKLEAAFSYAAEKEVAIVLAAGNHAAQWEDYPGSPDTVIPLPGRRLAYRPPGTRVAITRLCHESCGIPVGLVTPGIGTESTLPLHSSTYWRCVAGLPG